MNPNPTLFAWNWTSIVDPKSSQAPLGRPRCPKWPRGGPSEPKGGQSDARENPLGARGAPKGPKRNPKSPQCKQNEFQRHPTESNKSENYIHIIEIHPNSRSTAIQRPSSILLRLKSKEGVKLLCISFIVGTECITCLAT